MGTILIQLDLNAERPFLCIAVPLRGGQDIRNTITGVLGKQDDSDRGSMNYHNIPQVKYHQAIQICEPFYDKYQHYILGRLIQVGHQNADVYEYPKNKTDSISGELKFTQTVQKRILNQALIRDNYIAALLTGKIPGHLVDKTGVELYQGLEKLGFDMQAMMQAFIRSPDEDLRRFAVVHGGKYVVGLVDKSSRVRKTAERVHKGNKSEDEKEPL